MSGLVRILVSRHAAFYTPLIATIAGGFLKEEGLASTYAVKPPDRGTFAMLEAGEVDVVQSAVSSNWGRIEQGLTDLPAHFAQINRRDGFWITSRNPDPFRWSDLEGKHLLADHGPQPLAMLRYAAIRQGVDWEKVSLVDAGGPSSMDSVFRSGAGDFIHQQGPAPQQLERDGVGHIAASVGEAMPQVAFSSLMASREYLVTPEAAGFGRAYRKALVWIQESPPAEIAVRIAGFFESVDPEVLGVAMDSYKQIGCWSSDPEIPEAQYQQSLEVFSSAGLITGRPPYDEVVVPTPE
jgi:NitT/TauT family transport system substrate-binding protein